MTLPTAPTPKSPQTGQEGPQKLPYTYVATLEGYEVIAADGSPTGIVRDTKRSANGVAQSFTRDARRVIAQRERRLNQRARVETR